jgi:hypothetical protein
MEKPFTGKEFVSERNSRPARKVEGDLVEMLEPVLVVKDNPSHLCSFSRRV